MKQFYIFLIIVGLVTISIPITVFAVITIDNSGRREYVYCPVLTLPSTTTYEINGCPSVRIYVNNWNSLTPLQQTSIDTQLRAEGFIDAGEFTLISNGVSLK